MVGEMVQYVEVVVEKDGKIVFIGSLVNVEVLFFDVVKFDFEG